MVVRAASATGDFVLRLAFFALAPWVFLFFSLLVPVGAILFNLALTLFVFFIAEAYRAHIRRGSIAYKLMRRQLALADFYRRRPPRPFIYYLLYPLLAPYWLLTRDGRSEFRLFRRFLIANAALLAIFRVVEYQRWWQPDIGFGPFLKASVLILLFQSAFVTAFIVPVMVTVVDAKLHKKRRRLGVYATIFALSGAFCVLAYVLQPSGAMTPAPVCARMRERSVAQPERAEEVQRHAIEAALAVLADGKRNKKKTGEEISGPPLDRARAELGAFYRGQEVDCFRVFAMADGDAEVVVLRGDSKKRKTSPIWMALKAERQATRVLDDAADLPGGEAVLDDLTNR
jgi:hypothetical protein